MLESLKFTYDGESSGDYGVILASPSTGLFKDIFLPTRRITEKTVPSRNNPYFVRVDDEPLSFPLTFYIENKGDRNQMRQIARWLYKREYKPLFFESNPKFIFYAMVEGSSDWMHNGIEGYVTVNIRTNSSFALSPKKTKKVEVRGSESFYIANEGDLTIRPKLKIKKVMGNGHMYILNTKNNENFGIRNLLDNEEVTVDCVNEFLVSNLEKTQNRYLFGNHNDVWLNWESDINTGSGTTFQMTGNFDLEFEYEYAYLQFDDLLRDLD